MNRIGCGRGIGGALRHALQGENFVRHIGNDKLIFDFHEGSGTTIYDKSHCGNNGTLGTGAAAPTWRLNSLYFNGGNYVNLGVATDLNFTSEDFTISGYFKFEDTGQRFIFHRGNLAADGYFLWHQNATKKVVFRTVQSGVNQTSKTFADKIIVNRLHSLAIVRKGASARILIDGINETDTIGTHINPIGNASRVAYIGVYGETPESYFLGYYYSFRILNKGLSGIEAQQIYLSNKFSNN